MRWFFLCLFLALGCSEKKQNEIKEKCGSEDIKVIRKVDTISKDCREALSSFLPAPENNLKSRLFSFGHESNDFYLAAIDERGKALDHGAFTALTIKASIAGISTDLPIDAFTVEPVIGLSDPVLSLSPVTDYSASMLDEDITEVSSLFTDLVTNLNSIAESEHIIFSSSTKQKISFGSDLDALKASITIDSDFDRASTALFDGMGLGLDHLSTRSRPGRMIVVGTDGMENASSSFSKSDILSAIAAQNNLLVIVMANHFADLELIKQLTGNQGFYAFTETLTEAKSMLLEYSKALQQGVRPRLKTPYDTAESISVTLPGSNLSGDFSL